MKMGFLKQPFSLLWKYRNLLYRTTSSDIKGRYAGTLMGIAWLAIYPLLFLSLYAVVYVAIFKVRFGEMRSFDYVLMIFAGLIPFLNFVEMLGVGVNSVTSNSQLIKNTLFPIELIPVKAVLSCLPGLVISLTILETALIVCGKASFFNIIVLAVILLQYVFSIGLCWILSALNVFIKDIGQIIPIISLFLMLVSPIAYTIDMVPPKAMTFMYFNPLFYLIMLYRSVLLGSVFPWRQFCVFGVVSFALFYIGFALFVRLKRIFTDEC